jgi:hypothetical protein
MEPEIVLKSRAPNVPPHEHRQRLRRAPSVAGFGDSWRTQNGHIRNDTRDVSRRIPYALVT